MKVRLTPNEEVVRFLNESQELMEQFPAWKRGVLEASSRATNIEERRRTAMTDPELRHLILLTVADLVGDFVYYDRKGDEDLSADVLDDAVSRGVVTVEDIVQEIRSGLYEVFDPNATIPLRG